MKALADVIILFREAKEFEAGLAWSPVSPPSLVLDGVEVDEKHLSRISVSQVSRQGFELSVCFCAGDGAVVSKLPLRRSFTYCASEESEGRLLIHGDFVEGEVK